MVIYRFGRLGNDLEVVDMKDLGQDDEAADEPNPSKKTKLGSRKRT